MVFNGAGEVLKILVEVDPFEVPLAVSARLSGRLQEVLSEESVSSRIWMEKGAEHEKYGYGFGGIAGDLGKPGFCGFRNSRR